MRAAKSNAERRFYPERVSRGGNSFMSPCRMTRANGILRFAQNDNTVELH